MLSLEQVAQQLEETLTQLDAMAAHIVGQADVWRASPFVMMGKDGQPALAPIVIARAQALAAYTSIQVEFRAQERERRQADARLARLRGEL
jgi:hypothetical protein